MHGKASWHANQALACRVQNDLGPSLVDLADMLAVMQKGPHMDGARERGETMMPRRPQRTSQAQSGPRSLPFPAAVCSMIHPLLLQTQPPLPLPQAPSPLAGLFSPRPEDQ